ncbi:hypothetical protein SK128_011612, partial [Halocaridina rubra]
DAPGHPSHLGNLHTDVKVLPPPNMTSRAVYGARLDCYIQGQRFPDYLRPSHSLYIC